MLKKVIALTVLVPLAACTTNLENQSHKQEITCLRTSSCLLSDMSVVKLATASTINVDNFLEALPNNGTTRAKQQFFDVIDWGIKNNKPEAFLIQGYYYLSNEDYEKALQSFDNASALGEFYGQFMADIMRYEGAGAPQDQSRLQRYTDDEAFEEKMNTFGSEFEQRAKNLVHEYEQCTGSKHDY